MTVFLPFRLFRYFFKEALPFIGLTLAVLTILILAQQISKQTELFLSSSGSLLLSAKLITYLLPGILIITLPFALLIGSLIALNRLSADNEIIASRASGLNLFTITHPFIFLGMVGVCISAYFTIQTIPQLMIQAKVLRTQLLLELIAAPIKAQTFTTHFSQHLVYIQQIEKETGDWLGVFIVRKQDESDHELVLTADRGKLLITSTQPLTLEISLSNGLLLSSSKTDFQKQTLTTFQSQSIKLNSDTPGISQLLEKGKNIQELSLAQLGDQSSRGASGQERRQAQTEWHKRFSLPFACLILTILAVPLGISTTRNAGRAVAFTIGFIIAVSYYLVLLGGQNLALSGAIPAWIGVWLPNILGACVSLLIHLPPPSIHLPPSLSTPILRQHLKLSLNRRASAFQFKIRRPLLLSLTNYLVISEYLKYLFLCTIILVGTSLIFTLFDLLPPLNKSGLGWSYAGAYLMFLTPQILYYILPFASLIALLTAHSILSRSNQLTALLSSGLSLARISAPILLCSIALILALFWMSDLILPLANQEQDARYNKIKNRKNEQSIFAMGRHWVRSEDDTIYGFDLLPGNNTLLNTTAYRLSGSTGRLLGITQIFDSQIIDSHSWKILSGWSYVISPQNILTARHITPERGDMPENHVFIKEGSPLFRRMVNEAAKMTFQDLRSYIHYLGNLGSNTSALRVDLEKKLSYPFSILSLLVVAIPFIIKNRQRGSLAGIGISIVVGFSYWILASFFEGLGKQSYLPPGLSVWGPHALFISAGIFLGFRQIK